MERELLGSEPDVEAGDAESMIGGHSQSALVPRCRTLSGFALEAGCSEGIAIQSLAPGTSLIVQTRNSQYRLIVLDGGHGVLVQGGALSLRLRPRFDAGLLCSLPELAVERRERDRRAN